MSYENPDKCPPMPQTAIECINFAQLAALSARNTEEKEKNLFVKTPDPEPESTREIID